MELNYKFEDHVLELLKRIEKKQETILANFTAFQAALAALQETGNQLVTDVGRLISDYQSNGGDQATVDAATASLSAMQTALSGLDSSVDAADPAPASPAKS